MKYLLYLEPYTFIFKGNKDRLVYNTINSAYIRIYKCQILNRILDKLENPDNGYSVFLSAEEMQDHNILSFIKRLTDSFSGECILLEENDHKPFIFKPSLYLNSEVQKAQNTNTDKDYNANLLLHNLNEVTIFYLPHVRANANIAAHFKSK